MSVREINILTGVESQRDYTKNELTSFRIIEQDLTPQQKIVKLEAENFISQRRLREFVMLTTEAFKQATGNTLDISIIPGVATVFDVESKIKVLRGNNE